MVTAPPDQPSDEIMPDPTIVFDLDGTLVDTALDLTATLNRVLAAEGLQPVDTGVARTAVEHGARALLRLGFEVNKEILADDRLERLFNAFIASYGERIAEHSQPYPGAVEALDRFAARGWLLAICTNKTGELAQRLLAALGLHGRFVAICGADAFAVRKPDPGHLVATITTAGGNPGDAVMVGDSGTDIKTARAAGIPIVAVDFGYSAVPVRDLGPDAVISDFAGLDAAVDAIRRNPAHRLTSPGAAS